MSHKSLVLTVITEDHVTTAPLWTTALCTKTEFRMPWHMWQNPIAQLIFISCTSLSQYQPNFPLHVLFITKNQHQHSHHNHQLKLIHVPLVCQWEGLVEPTPQLPKYIHPALTSIVRPIGMVSKSHLGSHLGLIGVRAGWVLGCVCGDFCFIFFCLLWVGLVHAVGGPHTPFVMGPFTGARDMSAIEGAVLAICAAPNQANWSSCLVLTAQGENISWTVVERLILIFGQGGSLGRSKARLFQCQLVKKVGQVA